MDEGSFMLKDQSLDIVGAGHFVPCTQKGTLSFFKKLVLIAKFDQTLKAGCGALG